MYYRTVRCEENGWRVHSTSLYYLERSPKWLRRSLGAGVTAQVLRSMLAASISSPLRKGVCGALRRCRVLLIKCFVCVPSLQTALKCLVSGKVWRSARCGREHRPVCTYRLHAWSLGSPPGQAIPPTGEQSLPVEQEPRGGKVWQRLCWTSSPSGNQNLVPDPGHLLFPGISHRGSWFRLELHSVSLQAPAVHAWWPSEYQDRGLGWRRSWPSHAG